MASCMDPSRVGVSHSSKDDVGDIMASITEIKAPESGVLTNGKLKILLKRDIHTSLLRDDEKYYGAISNRLDE